MRQFTVKMEVTEVSDGATQGVTVPHETIKIEVSATWDPNELAVTEFTVDEYETGKHQAVPVWAAMTVLTDAFDRQERIKADLAATVQPVGGGRPR